MNCSETSNSETRVNTYRKYNSRCRTCEFANQDRFSWTCAAKRNMYDGRLTETRIRGILCKLYKARKFREEWYE